MSDSEKDNNDYIQSIKDEIRHEEFITRLEDNCSEFYNEMKLYLDTVGLDINPAISCVDIYNFIEVVLLPIQTPIQTRIKTRIKPPIQTRIQTRIKTRIKPPIQTRIKPPIQTRIKLVVLSKEILKKKN